MLENSAMKHVPTVRERDEAMILAVIHRFGPLSQRAVHRLTNLRPATISVLFRELLKDGKLSVCAPEKSAGRKQTLLRINERFGFALGVDFGPDFVLAAIMDLHPQICGEVVKEPTVTSEGIEGLVRQLVRCAGHAVELSGMDRQLLVGTGIGNPGTIDKRRGISGPNSTIPFRRDVPLLDLFEVEFGVPCLLDNSTRNRTVAERMLGAGEMADDTIYINMDRASAPGF